MLRRFLGLFVMIAGIIGLLLSLAGLVGIWMIRPAMVTSMNATIDTLASSVDTSQKTLGITNDALTATINTVDALSDMLGTTAGTVKDTQPVITGVEDLMGETLPSTLEAASDSLVASQQAAVSLESAIKSFEAFQAILQATPMLSAFLPASETSYNPEKSLADSLGELAVNLQTMPAAFEDMSSDLNKADDNLVMVRENLETMSTNVSLISDSLVQYQNMIGESQASMDSLKSMLTNFKGNLGNILNIATIVLVLFFLWLLAAQVVIFSQGLELYHGTASRMDLGKPAAEKSGGKGKESAD